MLDDIDKVESVIVRGSLSGLPEQRAWERIKKTLEHAQLSHNNERQCASPILLCEDTEHCSFKEWDFKLSSYICECKQRKTAAVS